MAKDILQYEFLKQLKALPFVRTIYLFGSRARGDNEERSDIDLAISCDPDAKWHLVSEILEEADTLLEIDYIDLDRAAEDIKENTYRDGIKLYERE